MSGRDSVLQVISATLGERLLVSFESNREPYTSFLQTSSWHGLGMCLWGKTEGSRWDGCAESMAEHLYLDAWGTRYITGHSGKALIYEKAKREKDCLLSTQSFASPQVKLRGSLGSHFLISSFIFKFIFIYVCMPWMQVAGGQKRMSDLWSWSYRQCEPPNVSTETWTQVLWKSSQGS